MASAMLVPSSCVDTVTAHILVTWPGILLSRILGAVQSCIALCDPAFSKAAQRQWRCMSSADCNHVTGDLMLYLQLDRSYMEDTSMPMCDKTDYLVSVLCHKFLHPSLPDGLESWIISLHAWLILQGISL